MLGDCTGGGTAAKNGAHLPFAGCAESAPDWGRRQLKNYSYYKTLRPPQYSLATAFREVKTPINRRAPKYLLQPSFSAMALGARVLKHGACGHLELLGCRKRLKNPMFTP